MSEEMQLWSTTDLNKVAYLQTKKFIIKKMLGDAGSIIHFAFDKDSELEQALLDWTNNQAVVSVREFVENLRNLREMYIPKRGGS